MEILFIATPLLAGHAVGFFLLAKGWRDAWHGLRARAWPTVPARLTECALERRASGRGVVLYQLRVAYEYQVGERAWQGHNVAIGYRGTNAPHVHRALQRRLLGLAPFMVRHHPRHPGLSTVWPAENALVFGPFLAGLAWLAGSAVATVIALAFSAWGIRALEGAASLAAPWLPGP